MTCEREAASGVRGRVLFLPTLPAQAIMLCCAAKFRAAGRGNGGTKEPAQAGIGAQVRKDRGTFQPEPVS